MLTSLWRESEQDAKADIEKNGTSDRKREKHLRNWGEVPSWAKVKKVWENAEKSLKLAIKSLDNAKVKGLVHKNKVDREKSRLTKKVNSMEVK